MLKAIKYRLFLWWGNPLEGRVKVWSLDGNEATIWDLGDGQVWQLD